MPDTTTSDSKTGLIKKLLVLLSVASFLIISLMVGLVISLPTIVSSARFKGFLESRISSAVHRQLQIKALKWEKTNEILIQNIRIQDDPVFSDRPVFFAENARFRMFWGEILKGRLGFDLMCDGIHAAIIRSKQGQTNVDMLLSGLKRSKSAPKKQTPIDLKHVSLDVPIDIQGRVHIKSISILVEDHMQAKQLALQNALIHFDMPSLYHKPITFKASTNIQVDNHQITDAQLSVLIKNLFDAQGRLTLTDAYMDVQGTGPGVEFILDGSLNNGKVDSRLDLDLFKLSEVLKPLIPPRSSPDRIMGSIKIALDGSGDSLKSLSFNTSFDGQNLRFAGGILGNKTLGPLNFNMTNSGILDAGTGRLVVRNGALILLEGSKMSYSGEIKNLYTAAPQADLKFDSIGLDVAELFDKFKVFIPKCISVGGNTPKHSATFEIKNVALRGPLPSGPHDLRIADLDLRISGLQFSVRQPQSMLLSTNNFRLTAKNFRSTLKTFFPTQMHLTAALTVDDLKIKGDNDIDVKHLCVSDITVDSDKIRRSVNSLVGLSARFKVKEILTAGQISLPPIITIDNFEQVLDAKVRLTDDTPVEIVLKDLKINMPSMVVKDFKNAPFKTHARLNCSVDAISLTDTKPFKIAVKGVQSDFRLDDIVAVDFKADIVNGSSGFVQAAGNVDIDMVPLSTKVISKVYDKLKLTGKTQIKWNVDGRLPDANQIKKLKSLAVDFKEDLGFIDDINIDCAVKDVGVNLAFSQNQPLRIDSVSTGSFLRYNFDKKTGKGQSGGKILLRGIHLPYGVLDKDLSADIIVSGEHDFFESIRFSQAGVLKPANIHHTLNLYLSGMDRIFKRSLKMPFPLWLKYVGGTVRGTLDVSGQADLTALLENLEFKGHLETGGELLLVPGETIGLKGWASSSDTSLQWAGLFGVKGLKTNACLKKEYRILRAEDARGNIGKEMPLSVRVLKAESRPEAAAAAGFDIQGTKVAQLIGAIQNRFSRQHAVAFRSAHMEIGPLPMSVDHSVIDFDLDKGLPNSDYFQVELLGGTVAGSFALIEKNNAFFLQTQLDFSGLNTDRIYPSLTPSTDHDSEISGRLGLTIPLSSRLENVLQKLQMDLKLSRIGSQSLERFLYALDPTESNETIVSQRRLLRIGSPRWIFLQVRDGNLSLDGEVDAKGVMVKIPSLRRLNVANISGLDQYADYWVDLDSVIKALKFCSADAVQISKDGRNLSFITIK